jgi:RimJ/RimL family protein N-acetyltransferase
MTHPSDTLATERLLLRPFQESDIPAIVRLLSDPAIAATTLNIPYPYDEENARQWLAHQERERQAGASYTFAIVRKEDDHLVGAIDIHPKARHQKAEIGYWIGKPYWGKGYATEAARAIIRFGFEDLGLNRIYALHFTGNPASGRVMQKAGMQFEGVLRDDVKKGDTFRDHAVYAILRREWEQNSS